MTDNEMFVEYIRNYPEAPEGYMGPFVSPPIAGVLQNRLARGEDINE